jgi:hypothetical protein
MDPFGWERAGKIVDSHENQTAQVGTLGHLDGYLRWNLSGYAIKKIKTCHDSRAHGYERDGPSHD